MPKSEKAIVGGGLIKEERKTMTELRNGDNVEGKKE